MKRYQEFKIIAETLLGNKENLELANEQKNLLNVFLIERREQK